MVNATRHLTGALVSIAFLALPTAAALAEGVARPSDRIRLAMGIQ